MKKLLLSALMAVSVLSAHAAWNVEVSMSAAFSSGTVGFQGQPTVGCAVTNGSGLIYTLTTTPTTYNGAGISPSIANIVEVVVWVDTLGQGVVNFCSTTPGTGKTLTLNKRTGPSTTIHYDVITWTASLISLYFYP